MPAEPEPSVVPSLEAEVARVERPVVERLRVVPEAERVEVERFVVLPLAARELRARVPAAVFGAVFSGAEPVAVEVREAAPSPRSRAATRLARPSTWSLSWSRVSSTRRSSTASRSRVRAWVTSSKSSWARFCAPAPAPATPPAAPAKVRSTASRRTSAALLDSCAFLAFSFFFPMAREAINAQQPLAERVLVPGDPGRALRLAQVLIDGPKMLNHRRGLWGYSGPAVADGEPLSIQSTGIGGPSAAIVVEELVALGARRLVRIGTCTAMDGALALGDLVVADRVLALDGTSRALGAAGTLVPDAALTRALEGDATGAVVSADSYAAPADGALVRDLQTAAVLAAARRHGVPAAAVLLVTALPGAERLSGEEALHAAEERLGRVGARALGAA